MRQQSPGARCGRARPTLRQAGARRELQHDFERRDRADCWRNIRWDRRRDQPDDPPPAASPVEVDGFFQRLHEAETELAVLFVESVGDGSILGDAPTPSGWGISNRLESVRRACLLCRRAAGTSRWPARSSGRRRPRRACRRRVRMRWPSQAKSVGQELPRRSSSVNVLLPCWRRLRFHLAARRWARACGRCRLVWLDRGRW